MSQQAAGPKSFRCDGHAILGDVARVRLSGEVDATDAWSINLVLHECQVAAVLTILDLRGPSALGPAVTELVTAADARAREYGRKLVILHDPGMPRAELEALGLEARLLTIDEPVAPGLETPERRLDRAVIRVWGELDIATGPELAASLAVQAARGRPTLLDLSGVEFMDSTGLRLLIQTYERARHDGLGFELITSEAVDYTLEVAGLRRYFGCLAPHTPA